MRFAKSVISLVMGPTEERGAMSNMFNGVKKMNHGIFKTGLRFGVGLAMLLGMISCAEQEAPINRVQANALDKSFFV